MINEGVLQRELKIEEFQKKINEVGPSVIVAQFMLLFYRNFCTILEFGKLQTFTNLGYKVGYNYSSNHPTFSTLVTYQGLPNFTALDLHSTNFQCGSNHRKILQLFHV